VGLQGNRGIAMIEHQKVIGELCDELTTTKRRVSKIQSDLVAICALLHQARNLISDNQNKYNGRIRDRIDIVLTEIEKSL
jgi:hypothetical protein